MSSDRLVFSGATVMAACACGTSGGVSSIFSQAGAPVASGIVYPAILGTGAALFLTGLRDRPRAWLPAAMALLALAAAGTLAPPRIFRDGYAFTDANLVGFGMYYVMVAFFIWTAIRLYRPAQLTPALLSLGGVGLAAGCTCCLTPGATRFLALEAGIFPPWLVSRPLLLLVAVVLATLGLMRSAGLSAVFMLLAGAVVAYPVETGVEKLVPTLTIGGANLTFLLRYPLWVLGTGLLLFAASRSLFPMTEPSTSEQGSRAQVVATA